MTNLPLAPGGQARCLCLDPGNRLFMDRRIRHNRRRAAIRRGRELATQDRASRKLILDLLADGKELPAGTLPQPKPEYPERTVQNAKRNMGDFRRKGVSADNGITSSRRSSHPNPQVESAKRRPFALCTFALSREFASITQKALDKTLHGERKRDIKPFVDPKFENNVF